MNDVLSETKRLLSVKRIALSATREGAPCRLPRQSHRMGRCFPKLSVELPACNRRPTRRHYGKRSSRPKGAASPVAGRLAVCEESSLPLAFSPSPFALEPFVGTVVGGSAIRTAVRTAIRTRSAVRTAIGASSSIVAGTRSRTVFRTAVGTRSLIAIRARSAASIFFVNAVFTASWVHSRSAL